jgi:hypothetical protein
MNQAGREIARLDGEHNQAEGRLVEATGGAPTLFVDRYRKLGASWPPTPDSSRLACSLLDRFRRFRVAR